MAQTKITHTKIQFPFSFELNTLFKSLAKNGDELRVVGGAVRDFLIKKPITDFDLACKFPPERMMEILNKSKIRSLPTGIKYGTITAIIKNKQFQVTTLRRDVKNFGRDCDVEFTDDFLEDAKRRDFTINALSIDQDGNLYDYFDGESDLKNQIVRFIGDAETRIKEDYLRILRFFRFSCSYAKKIDKSGLEASIKHKNHLNDLSAERIKEEIFKMFKCQNRESLLSILQIMFEHKILNLIFPDISGDRIEALKKLFYLEKKFKIQFEITIFLAILIIDEKSRFNLSNAEKKYLKIITKPSFDPDFTASKKDILKLLLKFSSQELIDIYLIDLVMNNNFENSVDDFTKIRKIILSSHIPDFPITGHDLIELKINPKNIGETLEVARNYWCEKDFSPVKKEILSFIKKQSA